LVAFSRVVSPVWFVSVRIPLPQPCLSRPSRKLSAAPGLMVLLLAGAMAPGLADAGEAFHTAAISPALPTKVAPSKPFHASAASVAPLLQTAAGEWYHRMSHSATQLESVARLEAPTKADAGAAGSADRKPVATLAALPPKEAAVAAVLAFADPSPEAEGGALAAIRSIAPDAAATGDGIDIGALEIEDVPVPVARPQRDEADSKSIASLPPADKPIPSAPSAVLPPPQGAPSASEKAPSGGLLKKLFGGGKPRAGNKVAVYDISAARVYMPDGSVLEAHSGIGKMADNPRYVHVKMNGPTPPQTYDLKMRESRFHGVEAVRMTPVGNQTMHGRDGMLTHSYLLRGRPGQSHGCVAFKEYHKFLSAFKKGHVKRIIVVPGGGAGVFARANSRPGDDA
jgi:hypothetical protein